jgi:hypothetical protein
VATVTQDFALACENLSPVTESVPAAELRRRIGHRMNNRVGMAHFGGVVLAAVSGEFWNDI